MKKSTAENIIKLFAKNGVRVFKHGDDIGMQGNGFYKTSNDSKVWTFLSIHKDELFKHFGVSA